MRQLTIKVMKNEDQSYPVVIGQNILGEIIPEIENILIDKKIFIVTDKNVEKAGCLSALLKNKKVPFFVIEPPGEVSKNIDMVENIIFCMEDLSLGRDTVLLAFGGGTIGDMGGFAAAIFKRGIPYVQIPTTTVAQADSSVGGKAGVDSSLSKNAYGAFKQPIKVYIDVNTLLTLDDRNYRAGLVESIKHGLIRDAGYFDFLEKNIDKILNKDLNILEKIACKNCEIKGKVVSQDPEEKNLRRILNYGHTVGHAVESESGFELLHGEAVAVGILAAGQISEQMKLLSGEENKRIKLILKRLGMPDRIPGNISFSGMIKAIARDKKSINKSPRFVLLKKIGEVYCPEGQYAVEIDKALIEETIRALSG
jgi:3-dehydroquinate synthase